MAETKLRYAVVTGANKGIGFETVKMLASNGVKVVLTVRDEKKGLEAIEKLRVWSLRPSDFHQLDVTDPASIASLVEFVKTQFGRLDILVNNAGIIGVNPYETNIPNEWTRRVFDDVENLTEERIDEVLKEFIKDFKEGSLESKGWPTFLSAYRVSKAAMNSYTRILAKKHSEFCINCVCPGFVKTDISRNTGMLSVDQGAASVVRLALLPDGSPSGLFFIREEMSNF